MLRIDQRDRLQSLLRWIELQVHLKQKMLLEQRTGVVLMEIIARRIQLRQNILVNTTEELVLLSVVIALAAKAGGDEAQIISTSCLGGGLAGFPC